MIWLSRINTITKLSEFTYFKLLSPFDIFYPVLGSTAKILQSFIFTFHGSNSQGFKMGFMILMNKG